MWGGNAVQCQRVNGLEEPDTTQVMAELSMQKSL